VRVSYQELFDAFVRVLRKTGLEDDRARLCARLIADASRDGVPSHGLNLFPRLIAMIRAGVVDVHARPVRVSAVGALERWDGQRGIGNLNAHASMDAAIALARAHGIGCVALSNTNHWMRGGTYGWQAAEAGVIGICWTNTLPNLPPWGETVPRVGNNPLVIAVPRPVSPSLDVAGDAGPVPPKLAGAHASEGGHVVLDMAMSQFSYGALASYRRRGEALPVPGGYDASGELTTDPAAIEASHRPLPIGFWKGSGLALMLDMMAALLSGGRATHEIPAHPEQETGLSQVFIAVDPSRLDPSAMMPGTVDAILEDLQTRYPGERALETRRQNLEQGIPVEPSIFELVRSL
jgi:3-dehydro-L-gulonate 2-dehydrogenase